MGLLDALFQNDSGGGGLLDFLRNNAMNQPLAQTGSEGQAQYTNPLMMGSMGGPQASPLAQPSPLDSAQWPYGPNGAPSQANAQMPPQQPPIMAQPQPQPAPQQPTAPQGPGIGDRIVNSAQSFANSGGPLQALVNGATSLFTGQRTDPGGIADRQQQQSSNMTARALIARGVDPQVAIAAVQPGNTQALNELFKQVASQGSHAQETDKDGNVWDVNRQTGQRTIALAAKDDAFQPVTTKNADGSESKQSFNKKTGEFSGAPAPPPGKFSVDPSLTGKERLDALKAVDPLYARKIESLVAGDLPMPTGVAALRPESKRMIEDALAVDGSTSASDFQTRAATRKDYASGIASRVTKSINTTIGHFATLDQAVDKLGNYSYFPKVANAIHDVYSSNTDPKYQMAKATFETNKEAAVKELDYALSGGHSSVSGSAELRDKFNRADSPEALHSAITEAMSLLQKRLESHTKAFTEGTKSQRDPQDFIYPENQQAFSKMLGQPAGSTSSLQPGQSTNIGGVSIKRVN